MDILRLVKKLLARNIDAVLRENACNEIVVGRKENLIRFQEYINFSPGVRINGNRSNSVWGESFEKREILRRAIDSYQK